MPWRRSPSWLASPRERSCSCLDDLGIDAKITPVPNEVPDAIPFADDDEHDAYGAYGAEAMHRFWLSLVDAHRVMSRFRADFRGKASPVHFFWGSFDLAVTRFSGRRAPRHPGGVTNCPDWVMAEAYSDEVSSCGYWPGGGEGIFYSHAYPSPPGSPRIPSFPVASMRSLASSCSRTPPCARPPTRKATCSTS